MKLYKINDDYINYLRRFDDTVADPKESSVNSRPYCGVLIEINGFTYYAPLSSKSGKYIDNRCKIAIMDKNDKIGIIRLLNMIPVSNNQVEEINIRNELKKDKNYGRILIKELEFIRKNEYRIIKKSNKLHTDYKLGKDYAKKYCCDFKILEKKCIEYNKLTNKQTPKIKM